MQISALIEAGGISAVPWSLVVYMIPGVIVGAQIAAALQGRFTKVESSPLLTLTLPQTLSLPYVTHATLTLFYSILPQLNPNCPLTYPLQYTLPRLN